MRLIDDEPSDFEDDVCDDEKIDTRTPSKEKRGRQSATSYAVKLLAYKTYTEHGLREKLKNKGYVGAEIDEALDFVKKQGYINDALIAQNALEKLSVKYGKRRIFAYLASKGIPREVIEGLDTSEIDFKESAKNVAMKLAAKGKESDKIAASLSRYGFTSSEIYYALDGLV
jgi:SOS response regulatory protein OraA/RecX